MKAKTEGRINLLLGAALNDELDQATKRLLQKEGLITSKTDLIRSAVAVYVRALPNVLSESKVLTVADIQQSMLSRLGQRRAPLD